MRCLILSLGLVLGVGAAVARTPEEMTKEFRIAISQEFENPNPLIMQMAATSYIYAMCGRTLNTLDPAGKVVEQLAVSTPALGKGAELYEEAGVRKLKATWEIRPEATWGDNTPVTGRDVEFSWQVGCRDTVSVGEREVYSDIEKIVVDPANPKRFTLYYRVAKWDFYKMFSFYLLPRHLEEPVFREFGGQRLGYDKNSNYSRKPTLPGLYHGPYRVTEVALGDHVILEPNKTFWGKPPALQKIVLRFIPETATLAAHLQAGDIDMIATLGLTFDQALEFATQAARQKLPYTVAFQPGLVYEHVDLNLNHPALKDVRVRQALAYALNLDELCTAFFGGKQTRAYHLIAPLDPWYTDDPAKISVYRFSRRQARKLLDEAGWPAAADGLRYRNGQRLSFQLMTTAGNKSRERVEEWLQNEWQKVGIEITLRNEPANVFFGETVRKGKFPAMAMFAWMSNPESTPRSTCHRQSIPTEANGFAGQNAGGWANAEVDGLVEQLEREFDPARRLPLIHKILYHYTADVPAIPLFYRANTSVTPGCLRGYQLVGHQFSEANQVEAWR